MNIYKYFLIFILSCSFFLVFKFLFFKDLFFAKNNNVNNLKNNILNEYTCNNHDDNNIIIKNDLLIIKISLKDGNIKKIYLTKFLERLNSYKLLNILSDSKNSDYELEQNLNVINEKLSNNENINSFKTKDNKNFFFLKENEKELKVSIYKYNSPQITYVKNFILKKNSYLIKITYDIFNYSRLPLKSYFSVNIKNRLDFHEDNNYKDIALYSKGNNYKKYNIKSINKNILIKDNYYKWITLLQKYFLISFLSLDNYFNNICFKKDNNIITVKFNSSYFNLFPNKINKISTNIWAGPKIREQLINEDKSLELLIDYGFFWFISYPSFEVLKILNKFFKNWGISIIFFTILIRIVIYPIVKSQYESMIKIKNLQPEISIIKNKFFNDKNKQNEEIIKLYKLNKINPFSGCLSVFLQMPIFFSLYNVLSNSVELRHSPFMFWIKDLSEPDNYFILPILMTLTTFVLQVMSNDNIDHNDNYQNLFSKIVPFIFTIFFLWLPSGLVLYYVINNVFTIFQQKVILSLLINKKEK
ncbi:MAG: membrane protein insertase YidC [Enterobacteriaceae bacterium]